MSSNHNLAEPVSVSHHQFRPNVHYLIDTGEQRLVVKVLGQLIQNGERGHGRLRFRILIVRSGSPLRALPDKRRGVRAFGVGPGVASGVLVVSVGEVRGQNGDAVGAYFGMVSHLSQGREPCMN